MDNLGNLAAGISLEINILKQLLIIKPKNRIKNNEKATFKKSLKNIK